jgi:ketosteroid isomerase-like protein
MAETADTVRQLYAAFARGDVPAVLGALASDVRWTEADGFPHGGTYIGPDAVLPNVFMTLNAERDRFAAVAQEFVADAGTVVVLGDYSGTCKATGRSFSAPFAHVWTLRDGKVATFRQHTDTAIVQRALQ